MAEKFKNNVNALKLGKSPWPCTFNGFLPTQVYWPMSWRTLVREKLGAEPSSTHMLPSLHLNFALHGFKLHRTSTCLPPNKTENRRLMDSKLSEHPHSNSLVSPQGTAYVIRSLPRPTDYCWAMPMTGSFNIGWEALTPHIADFVGMSLRLRLWSTCLCHAGPFELVLTKHLGGFLYRRCQCWSSRQ